MAARPKQQLGLFDSTCLVVGIIIGAGVYQMPPDIAQGSANSWGFIGLWVLGGALSLCGALTYAELATSYPREGGDYVYLTHAYGPAAGFMFGWAQLAIVRPGDIAVMAFAFATYARTLWDPLAGSGFPHMQQVYAVAATVILTVLNVWGVQQGKWTQNLLTSAKVLGLLLVVAAGFMASPLPAPAASDPPSLPTSLALIFVLFVFGGWNEMAYVASEVRDGRRNIVRALVLGTAAVTGLYLLINTAFLHALGFGGIRTSEAVATDTVARVFPNLGAVLISTLICISALGAINGLIFTGARISYAVGRDHRPFRALGQWHARRGTPTNALIVQGGIAVLLIILLGSFLDAVLYTAAVVYSFYAASTLAVFVLRRKQAPQARQPFRVPGYPVTPLIFVGVCLFLIHAAATYKPKIALMAGGLLLVGGVVWKWNHRVEHR